MGTTYRRFSLKGAPPGNVINRLLVKAITALEVVGARVPSVW